MRSAREEYLGLGFFVHPVPAFAVLTMALNDHYLKYAFPGWWTGKLSDFCGLFFFPLFLCALGKLFWREALFTPKKLWSAIFVTDLVFMAIKLWPAATEVYLFILNQVGLPSALVRDPSDLLALAMNPVTYFFARRYFPVNAVGRKSSI